jgi:hypothetical protein
MRAFYTSKIFLSQFVVTSSLFFFHLASLKLESGVASCSNFVARVTPALSLQTPILFLSLRVWHDVVARAIT